jgi:hypothetical protein
MFADVLWAIEAGDVQWPLAWTNVGVTVTSMRARQARLVAWHLQA